MNIKHTMMDISAMIKRNLVHFLRVPQLVVFSSIQPVMFLLLFVYVFGGAINTGQDYIQYLLPGVLVQTIIFGSIATGIGLTQDLAGGMIDRFRSLPMSRSAVLAGRTITDIIRNIVVILLMVTIGYVIGFRIEDGLGNFMLAMLAALLFGFAFSWISATIGIFVKDVETAQSAGFIWVFPFVFASSIFVPVQSMPSWLEVFARNNPVSLITDLVRSLTLKSMDTGNSLELFIWIFAIFAVFIPLAIYRYRKIS